MTIGKKLYWGFGSILAIMLFLLVMNIFTVQRQYTARSAVASTLVDVQTIEAVRYKIMENRLALGNYLLSGDLRDEDKTNRGISDLVQLLHQGEGMATDQSLRAALSQVEDNEHNWADNFAKEMIAKRHQVEAGHSTIAELQSSTFSTTRCPGSTGPRASWMKPAAPYAERRKTRTNLPTRPRWSAPSLRPSERCLPCSLGGLIAFFTAKSIKEPLHQLIDVAHRIGDTGDLDQSIDIRRRDEVGVLAENFNKMIVHLKQMASVSAAIAEGQLVGFRAAAFCARHDGRGVRPDDARPAGTRSPGSRQRIPSGQRRGPDGDCLR